MHDTSGAVWESSPGLAKMGVRRFRKKKALNDLLVLNSGAISPSKQEDSIQKPDVPSKNLTMNTKTRSKFKFQILFFMIEQRAVIHPLDLASKTIISASHLLWG